MSQYPVNSAGCDYFLQLSNSEQQNKTKLLRRAAGELQSNQKEALAMNTPIFFFSIYSSIMKDYFSELLGVIESMSFEAKELAYVVSSWFFSEKQSPALWFIL